MTKIYLANDEPKRQRKGGRRNAEQPLTDYTIPLAFNRIHLYLDVLDAHFAVLGATLEGKQAEKIAKQENPARDEKAEREVE